ncbi:MAG: histidine phosphatase family protein [Chloroflexi bacterium]|nr:histidine phosphatase family protein [Chloroflexota bacterium]
MELFIIRHAQSTNNALADHRNRVRDPLLTELGQRQAEIVAQYLSNGILATPWKKKSPSQGHGITRLYCSAMWRSLQTAQQIGQALGLLPEVWIDIHERGGIFLDHGAEGVVGYPGKMRTEILTAFPNYILPDGITEQGWWHYPGQEIRSAFHERALRVANVLRGWAANDERIAIVTHGTFIDTLLKTLFKQTLNYDVYYHHLSTAITWIGFHSDGHLDVEYLNSVHHLPPELVS